MSSEAQRRATRAWKKRNPEKVRDQKRRHDEKHRKEVRERFRKWREKNRAREVATKTRWAKKNMAKVLVAQKLRYEVEVGAIERGTICERCGEPAVHGHHHDYSKPLEVEWLCARCHSRAHHKRFDSAAIGGCKIF